MIRLSKEGLELIKKKYKLKNNVAVARHIDVNYTTLWRAMNDGCGSEFVAKTLKSCPDLSYEDIFFTV